MDKRIQRQSREEKDQKEENRKRESCGNLTLTGTDKEQTKEVGEKMCRKTIALSALLIEFTLDIILNPGSD